jgi:hypothetical protein
LGKIHINPGCYRIWFDYQPPSNRNISSSFEGTFRVQKKGKSFVSSGDLYCTENSPTHWRNPTPEFCSKFKSEGIPTYPRNQHQYYFLLESIKTPSPDSSSIELFFQLYRFSPVFQEWLDAEFLVAQIHINQSLSNTPYSPDFLSGPVFDSNGIRRGNLAIFRVSSFLRRASLELASTHESDLPLENGNGIEWKNVFEGIDWDLKFLLGPGDLKNPNSDKTWSNQQLHQTMVSCRSPVNLDAEWRYHLLCVPYLQESSRGLMYDFGETDSNFSPREGSAISTHWVFPDNDLYCNLQGKRFGHCKAPFFRTAVHEIGHAMGLINNLGCNNFMNSTNGIASNPGEFPEKISWHFSEGDEQRLRHFPDPLVRPGGISYGFPYYLSPFRPDRFVVIRQ